MPLAGKEGVEPAGTALPTPGPQSDSTTLSGISTAAAPTSSNSVMPASPAPAGADVTLHVADFCESTPPEGVTYDNDDLVIDLSHWGDQGPDNVLTITAAETWNWNPCTDTKSVTFKHGTEGVGFTNLTIEEYAFQQTVFSGDNVLKSVTFPNSLNSLTIGAAAFQQITNNGDNVLKSVTFPDSLNSLSIAEGAFSQRTETSGNNALESVTFPASPDTLTIGQSAFYQHALGGEDNALKSVVFPQSLNSLDIGRTAFYRKGAPEDLMLFFPFEVAPDTVGLDYEVTAPESLWVWLGADQVSTTDAWDAGPVGLGPAGDYELRGTRTAQFEPNGGLAVESLYVFPQVDGEPQVATLADINTLDPAGFRASAESPEFVLDLPVSYWPITGQAEFNGWCVEAWVAGECSVGAADSNPGTALTDPGVATFAAADSNPGTALTDPGVATFAAGWETKPEAPELVKATQCGVTDTVTIPEDVEGLYSYQETSAGSKVTVTAEPAGEFVSFSGESEWSFELETEPCPKNPSPEPPVEAGETGTGSLPATGINATALAVTVVLLLSVGTVMLRARRTTN